MISRTWKLQKHLKIVKIQIFSSPSHLGRYFDLMSCQNTPPSHLKAYRSLTSLPFFHHKMGKLMNVVFFHELEKKEEVPWTSADSIVPPPEGTEGNKTHHKANSRPGCKVICRFDISDRTFAKQHLLIRQLPILWCHWLIWHLLKRHLLANLRRHYAHCSYRHLLKRPFAFTDISYVL